MFPVQIINPTDSTYIKATPIIHTIGRTKSFDIENRKDDILLSAIGSRIAETSFSPNITTNNFIIGRIIVEIIKSKPLAPTEFFINRLLATIKSNPSDR